MYITAVKDSHKTGFTIVELLIVIVIIGILAAITIVAYNGIQNRGYDSSVQSDLRNIGKKLEIARVDSTNDSYPTSNVALATAMGSGGTSGAIKVNKNAYTTSPNASYNLLMCFPTTSSPTEYAILGYSKSGKRFYLRTGGSATEYTGATSWAGGVAGTICDSVAAGWTASGAGYSAADGTTGPWRDWAGGN